MNNLPKIIALTLLILPMYLSAQSKDTLTSNWRPTNLVQNGSFEMRTDSTKKFSLYEPITKVLGWTSPNKSQPLIYSTDAKGFIFDPNGTEWSFKARTGRNVAGLNIHNSQRDYVQGSLTKPLVMGKKYYFAFWVHYHCSGANNIGIAFLPEKISLDSNVRIPLKPATYQKEVARYSNDAKSAWALVRDSFVAQMPFQSFIIGNFFTDEETKLEKGRFDHFFAYIDDVAVWEARKQPNTDNTSQAEKDDWKRNTVIVTPKNVAITLNDVFFGYNSAILESRSFLTLDSLVQKMNLLKTMKIHIMGHTSSEGGEELNLKLSDNRAHAVMEYLIKQGIENTRLSAEGLGSILPITSNETEEGRKQNRRVTFVRIE